MPEKVHQTRDLGIKAHNPHGRYPSPLAPRERSRALVRLLYPSAFPAEHLLGVAHRGGL